MIKNKFFFTREGFNTHKESLLKILLINSIIFVLMQALFIWTLSSTLGNIKKEFWNQEGKIFQKSVSIIDTDINLMNAYCKDLAQSSAFYRLTQFEDSNANNFYYSAMKVKNSLSTNIYTAGDLPIKHFFAYLWNTDYVLSNNRFDSSSLFYNGIQSYPDGYQKEWEQTLKDDSIIYSFYDVDKLTNSNNEEFYYAVNMNKISYKKMPATIVFSISLDEVKNKFSSLLQDGCEIVILNKDNYPILNLKANENKTINYSLSQLINSSDDEIKIDNTKYHINNISSESLKWKFILIQPASLAKQQIVTYQKISYIIIAITALLGILLIIYLIGISLQPLMTLDTQLQTVQGDKDKLETFINDRTPILYKTYVREIMRGLIVRGEELRTARDFLNLNNPAIRYLVLYVIAYNNSNETYNKNDFDNAIVNELYKEFSLNNKLYFFSPDERAYALLLPFTNDEEEYKKEVENKLILANKNLLNDSAIWIFGGIGGTCDKLKRVWTIYQQARTAAQLVKSGKIFNTYTISEKEFEQYYYPTEVAEQLTYFITKSNEHQVKELFELINRENFTNRRLSSEMVAYLINDIKNTIIKCRLLINDNKQEDNKKLISTIDRKLQSQLSISTLEHISQKLCELFDINNDNETLIESIQIYIKENYQDPSLCLTKIADEFLISESYVSHLFKKEKNINFSTFLEKLRLDAAMKILKCENCKVSNLYKQVGYNNPTSFRRAFKKRYGVPPSSIRN